MKRSIYQWSKIGTLLKDSRPSTFFCFVLIHFAHSKHFFWLVPEFEVNTCCILQTIQAKNIQHETLSCCILIMLLTGFSAFDPNLFQTISFPFIHTCRTTRHIANFTKSNAFLPKLKFFRHQLNTNFRGKTEVKRKFLWKFLKFLKRNSAYPMT